jgi:hypothetical protein
MGMATAMKMTRNKTRPATLHPTAAPPAGRFDVGMRRLSHGILAFLQTRIKQVES